MAWTKAEREDFHQLDLAVTRLEARIQIISEDLRRVQPAPQPPVSGGLPSMFSQALGSIL